MAERTPTTDKRIHVAFTTYTPGAMNEMGDKTNPRQWWVSLNAEEWLPVNRPPVADTTADEIAELFEPRLADGTRLLHMRYARRYLDWAINGELSYIAGGAYMPAGWYASSEDIQAVTV